MKELLKPDPEVEARLTDFDNRIIARPILETVPAELRAVIRRPAGSSLVATIEPTGGGKSTHAKRTYHDLLRESIPVMEANPGVIRLQDRKAEVAHLKMTLSPDSCLLREVAVVNLVRNDFVPELP